jgi:hypothetical protein
MKPQGVQPEFALSLCCAQRSGEANRFALALNKDEVGRTMYQVGQSMARQLQAATR